MSSTGMGRKSAEASSPTGTIGCGLLAGIIMGSIGIVLLPVGMQKLNRDTAMSPMENFEELDAPCRIVGVLHHVDKREQTLETKSGDSATREQQWVCWDQYVYMFTSEGSMYKSREEAFKRGASTQSDCDSVGEQKPGSFSKDQEVRCWKPIKSSVPDQYRCGNGACLKIFDPESEFEVQEGVARMMILGGGALLGIGISLCAGFAALSCWSAGQSQEKPRPKDRPPFSCELRNLAVTIGDHPKDLPELP